jgi:hypothetical protein
MFKTRKETHSLRIANNKSVYRKRVSFRSAKNKKSHCEGNSCNQVTNNREMRGSVSAFGSMSLNALNPASEVIWVYQAVSIKYRA